MRTWKLAEANYGYIKENPYEVAILPLGATEPHNLHLPYGMDMFEAEIVSENACEAAHKRGANVVLLPTIPYGTETNQMAFPMAMNVNPSTLFAMVKDIVDSLAHHGIRKVVLLNSHGGNDFKPFLREMYGKTPARLFLCNWWQVLKDVEREIFEDPGDHGGELETSFAMAYFPDLVARRSDGGYSADDGRMAPTRFEAVNKGWVNITRPWHLLTTNSGAGNPHPGNADKARRMMELLVKRLSQFLVELSAAPVDEKFPF